jgi:hypothetical protein
MEKSRILEEKISCVFVKYFCAGGKYPPHRHDKVITIITSATIA